MIETDLETAMQASMPRDTVLQGEIPLSRHKLVRILQAMGDAVLVFDPVGRIILCNPALEKIFGLSQHQITGKTLHYLLKDADTNLGDVILELIASGEPFRQEVTIYLNKQKRVFLLSTIPIFDEETAGGGIAEGVAVFHDITRLHQTEKMRRDFVANVSHELRTPLSAINGYAETLLEGALDDSNVARDFIQVIFNHSQRLSALVRDLLDLSKLESEECPFELQPMELVPVIEKVIALSEKHRTQKGIRLHSLLPRPFAPVMAHAGSIEQVMTNLLDNAIKYTPAQGAISVRVWTDDGMARVDVEDTGMGIEAKHIPRLFERFYRVDKARSRDLGGTGLGLSIVKHIIQYHGGDVWVKSTPGQGTTFSFTLPLAL